MYVEKGSAPERFFTQKTEISSNSLPLRGDSAGMTPRVRPMPYPAPQHSRWWIKRGYRGRLAVVNYQPLGEQIGKHGYRYQQDALAELERLEKKTIRRRRELWSIVALVFIFTAIMVVWPEGW